MEKPVSFSYSSSSYKVDGKEYKSLEEVPAEYRSLMKGIEGEIAKNLPEDSQVTPRITGTIIQEKKNPPNGPIAVTKKQIAFSTLVQKTHDPNQKKFLEELVLPNLHLMDEKEKNRLFRELYKTAAAPKGFSSRLHSLFWVALGIGIALGLAMILGR